MSVLGIIGREFLLPSDRKLLFEINIFSPPPPTKLHVIVQRKTRIKMLRPCVIVDGLELEEGHFVAIYESKKCSLNFVVNASRARGTYMV